MRWENLKLEPETATPLNLPGAVARTFDTPEFRGVTCYEIRAKSILNRVPAAAHLPFEWTINPYRGCTHACTYCLGGDTRILMADGRTKALAALSVGDEIYGTERRGASRRYVRTKVLAHWSTTKPAYRVTLADGTRLVASADHRFLTDRGWKHVADLTTDRRFVGTGRFADGPKLDDDYRRGYLAGVSCGAGGSAGSFHLALDDSEALNRCREFLADFGVATTRLRFHDGTPARRPLVAVRVSAEEGIDALPTLIARPDEPNESWTRGFLGGAFDSTGAHSQHVSLGGDGVATALARLGFAYDADGPGRIRLRGDLRDRLRFLHTVDPAIIRKRTVDGVAIRSGAPLGVVSVEDLGMTLPLYDITTGTGDFIADGVVSHNCFARKTHTYLDLDSGHDFDSRIIVKVNAPELLRKELSSASWQGKPIAMGTNVDPYQRAEGKYQLMRGILKVLGDYANPFSILTKGTLVLRDLDLLLDAAQRTDVRVSVSVGSVDQSLWRQVESGAPSPQARLRVCRTLTDAGIGCGVLMAPILPFLTDSDEHLEATVAAIAEAGADSITPIVLHLRPGAREWYLGWLGGARPDLVLQYERLYSGGAYAPREYTRVITSRVAELARGYGIGNRPPRSEYPKPAAEHLPPEDQQLALL